MEEGEEWREGPVVSSVVSTYSRLAQDRRSGTSAREGKRGKKVEIKMERKETTEEVKYPHESTQTLRHARVMLESRQAAHSSSQASIHVHTFAFFSFLLSLRTEGLLQLLSFRLNLILLIGTTSPSV